MSFDFVEKVMTIGGTGNEVPTLQFYKRGFNLGGSGSQPSWQDIILSGNTALTLVNAKANGLNYLKLFGGTEQRNLPSGYTQVKYLQSSNTQWINTGYYPNQNTKFEISGTQGDTDSALFGLSVVFYCFNNSGSTTFYGFCGDSGSFNFTMGSVPVVLTMSATDGIVINGTKYIDLTASSTTADYPMALFGRMNNSTGEVAKLGYHRINYAKIYENNILIHSYIPCRRNSDNVLGMFDTVTGNFLTNSGTGTFTAGADVVPSPNTPMDIVCNNGVVKVFAGDKFTTEGALNQYIISVNTGEIVPNENYIVTDYIYLLAGTYTGTFFESPAGNKFFRAWSYNADDGTPIQEIFNKRATGDLETFNFSISENCYIRVSYRNSFTQMFKATTTTEIYTDGTVETVQVSGKNLFDKNDIAYNNSTILADGSIISAENISVLDYIPVQPNTIYTYSSTTNSARAYNKRIVCFDANKNYITSIADTTGNPSGQFSITGTTPANTRYIVVACSNDQMATAQLELSSTATAENLLKVGDYKDVQEVLTGSVTRNVGIKVLDGSEDWTQISGTNYVSLLKSVINLIGNTNATCLITSLKQVLHADIEASTNCFSVGTNYLNCKLSGATTVNQFKQYLASQYNAGTPVIIIYPLATATTETVTGQPLTTQAGTNIVEITQASIDNLGLEVSYKATV